MLVPFHRDSSIEDVIAVDAALATANRDWRMARVFLTAELAG